MRQDGRLKEESQYYSWRQVDVAVRQRVVKLVSKPGASCSDVPDPALTLLAEHVDVAENSTVLHLNAGAGLAGAALAMTGSEATVIMTDRKLGQCAGRAADG